MELLRPTSLGKAELLGWVKEGRLGRRAGPQLRSPLPAKLTHPRLASEEEEGEPSESAQARALPREGGRGKTRAMWRGCALGCPIPRAGCRAGSVPRGDARPALLPGYLPARITQAPVKSRVQPRGDADELQQAGAARELGRQPQLWFQHNLCSDRSCPGGGKNISAVRGFIAASDLNNKHSAERYNSNRFNSYHWALV